MISLSQEIEKYKSCMIVLLYPQTYDYDLISDRYYAKDDKHEWHEGSEVRRLKQLMEKKNAPSTSNFDDTGEPQLV
jgi:hypothetical protein